MIDGGSILNPAPRREFDIPAGSPEVNIGSASEYLAFGVEKCRYSLKVYPVPKDDMLVCLLWRCGTSYGDRHEWDEWVVIPKGQYKATFEEHCAMSFEQDKSWWEDSWWETCTIPPLPDPLPKLPREALVGSSRYIKIPEGYKFVLCSVGDDSSFSIGPGEPE